MMLSYLTKLATGSAPTKGAAALAGGILGYLFHDQASVMAAAACGALILLDTLTGVTAAWQAGESITSKAFSRTLTKVIGYGASVAVVAVVTRHIAGLADYQPVAVSSVLSLVIVTEAGSILENVRKMGVRLPFGIEELLRRRLGQFRSDSESE